MKTAKMRDVDGGVYWFAFFDDEIDGKRVSYTSALGDTEKEAMANLAAKERFKKAKENHYHVK